MVDKTLNSDGRKEKLLFGEWLIKNERLSRRKLHEALSDQHQYGGRLGEVLLRLKLLDDNTLTASLAEFLGMEYISLDNPGEVNMDVAKQIPEKIASRFCLIGIDEDEDSKVVTVAMADPLNIVAIDTVALKLKKKIKVAISPEINISNAIDAVYHGSHVAEEGLRELVELELGAEEDDFVENELLEMDIRDDELAATKAPVIRFVDLLLGQAIKRKASDVHMEPQDKAMIVRMRIDGVLRETIPPPRSMHAAIITRVKLLSGMNIAERRLPQDGRFKIKAPGRDIDVRVSSLPTIYGEKIVMRILDKKAVSHDLNSIGFEDSFLKEFKRVLKQPHGIIIVTGPTGSGKTTTLYSALNYMRDPRKNITTVENPVEYRLRGINQVQVRPEIDLTFSSCLRTILRQDPDVILIGEIRDKETVEIAIQASLTGHMVLSTFHTNDSAGAISRLIYMGIEPFLIVSSLNLIIAQRLIRRVCDKCKEPATLDEYTIRQLGIDPEEAKQHTVYSAHGCNVCEGTGYTGRLPIFEFLSVDDSIRKAITGGATEAEIRKLAREKGGASLQESGVRKMLEGITTAEEILEATITEISEL